MDKRSRLKHNAEQARYFDTRVDLFQQPIPDSIQDRARSIVRAARLDKNTTVLDVGTGLGVLIPYLLEQGVLADNIVGCDLSRSMLAVARSRFPSVRFWQGDFLDLPQRGWDENNLKGRCSFTAIFFNACFANLFDSEAAVAQAARLLAPKGRIVISHPLGSGFVAALHAGQPDIVPNLLPKRGELERYAGSNELRIDRFEDEDDYYLAILKAP